MTATFEQIVAQAPSQTDGAALFVYGLERLGPSDNPDWLMRQLNWRRGAYQRLGRPLVFWVPDYLLPLIARGAPDFGAWTSGLFEFTAPESEALLHQLALADTWLVASLTRQEKEERRRLLLGLLDEYRGDEPATRRAQARLYGELGLLDLATGDYRAAREKFGQALTMLQQIGDRAGAAATFYQLGFLAWELGRREPGLRLVALCYLIDRAIGHGDTPGDLRNLQELAARLGYSPPQLEALLQEVSAAYQTDGGRGLAAAAFD